VSLFRNIKARVPLSWKVRVAESITVAKNRLRGFRDYYHFPFEVNLPLNESASDVMREACGILDKLGVGYFICDGTALGLVRDGRFIPHDNDIDVAVFGEADLTSIKEAFFACGYRVGREASFRNRVQQLIFYSESRVIFDICFWYDGGDGLAYHFVPEIAKGRCQPNSNFVGHDTLTYQGHEYKTHPNIREWLRSHYGDDWMVPRVYKGDWRDEVLDIIL